MANGYRDGARKVRETDVVRFHAPRARLTTIVVGGLIMLGFGGPTLIAENRMTFECTRDASGTGTCVQTIHKVGRQSTTTYDLRAIDGVRLEESRGKHAMMRRVHLVTRDGDVPLNDWTSSADAAPAARRIDEFLTREPRPTEVHASIDERQWIVPFITFFAFVLGTFVAFSGASSHPVRRLVLDDEASLARLEERAFLRWRPRWSLPLNELRGIAMNQEGKGAAVVVDTLRDGRVTLISDAQPDDPAVDRVRAYLDRG